jgi:hypothetical protein
MGDERSRTSFRSLRKSRDGLWHDRDFLRFRAGQTASQLGSQTSQLTVPLVAVVALGAGAEQVGLLRAVQQIPILLIALFVGVWVDRATVRPWRRARLPCRPVRGRARSSAGAARRR